MTSPRVIELPRRLEPIARDTFLGAVEAGAPRAVSYLGNVVALQRRDALGRRRPPTQPTGPTLPTAA